jgi:hypothetical protein
MCYTRVSKVKMSESRTIVCSALALVATSCWTFTTSDDWCACGYGEDSCEGYDLLALCQDGCDWTYYDCQDVCEDAGYYRSEGCGWDPAGGRHACLCTDDSSCDCSAGQTDCWDATSLLTCDDGCFWYAWDCDDLCRSSGWDASSGCGYDFSTGEDTCFCEESCECTDGEIECWGSDSIASCDDGCSWTFYDCDDLCVDAGYDGSTGCGTDSSAGEDTCFCGSGCDCGPGEIECWDSESIASCDDGCSWYVYDCDELCVDAGYEYSTGCGTDWDAGEDTCFCEST